MPPVARRGEVPPVPHTEFRWRGRFTLEEIHGTYGFSGPHSRKVHLRSYPAEQSAAPRRGDFDLTPREPAEAALLQPFHFRTGRIPFGSDAVRGRLPLVYGAETVVSVSKPDEDMPRGTFFRNGEKHELWFVQEGEGTLASEYGRLAFRKGFYLAVPKGATYRVELSSKRAWFLIAESTFPIDFAPHYLNAAGQARLTAPVVETEARLPALAPPVDRRGAFAVDVKHSGGRVTRLTLGHHPFDLVGWEGALYPFAFDIADHHGIAREIHTAPPAHQTFQAGNAPHNGFSICSFVPQPEGWHPGDIAAPYAHSNVDSDECMFFSNAAYGARKGLIEPGSLTFHPASLPHAPQSPRAAPASRADRGKMSKRLAVMLDTFFESLRVTTHGWRWRDAGYAVSWSEAKR